MERTKPVVEQKQRIALLEEKVLVGALDQTFSGGDEKKMKRLGKLVRSLERKGVIFNI